MRGQVHDAESDDVGGPSSSSSEEDDEWEIELSYLETRSDSNVFLSIDLDS